MSDDNTSPSTQSLLGRRQCLCWLAGAAAANACALEDDGKERKAKGPERVGNLTSLAAESVTEIRAPHVFLVRTEKGVAAMSTWCTHQHRQLVLSKSGQISCPGHKSIFDLTGTPRGGPAKRPLPWYQTRVENDGAILVDTDRTVEQGQWAEVPAWARKKN